MEPRMNHKTGKDDSKSVGVTMTMTMTMMRSVINHCLGLEPKALKSLSRDYCADHYGKYVNVHPLCMQKCAPRGGKSATRAPLKSYRKENALKYLGVLTSIFWGMGG